MTGTVADWLAKARDDLHTVKLLLTSDNYPCVVAAFHCQQAVEKSLKALM
jgi:HEPN domain-containing protein